MWSNKKIATDDDKEGGAANVTFATNAHHQRWRFTLWLTQEGLGLRRKNWYFAMTWLDRDPPFPNGEQLTSHANTFSITTPGGYRDLNLKNTGITREWVAQVQRRLLPAELHESQHSWQTFNFSGLSGSVRKSFYEKVPSWGNWVWGENKEKKKRKKKSQNWNSKIFGETLYFPRILLNNGFGGWKNSQVWRRVS